MCDSANLFCKFKRSAVLSFLFFIILSSFYYLLQACNDLGYIHFSFNVIYNFAISPIVELVQYCVKTIFYIYIYYFRHYDLTSPQIYLYNVVVIFLLYILYSIFVTLLFALGSLIYLAMMIPRAVLMYVFAMKHSKYTLRKQMIMASIIIIMTVPVVIKAMNNTEVKSGNVCIDYADWSDYRSNNMTRKQYRFMSKMRGKRFNINLYLNNTRYKTLIGVQALITLIKIMLITVEKNPGPDREVCYFDPKNVSRKHLILSSKQQVHNNHAARKSAIEKEYRRKKSVIKQHHEQGKIENVAFAQSTAKRVMIKELNNLNETTNNGRPPQPTNFVIEPKSIPIAPYQAPVAGNVNRDAVMRNRNILVKESVSLKYTNPTVMVPNKMLKAFIRDMVDNNEYGVTIRTFSWYLLQDTKRHLGIRYNEIPVIMANEIMKHIDHDDKGNMHTITKEEFGEDLEQRVAIAPNINPATGLQNPPRLDVFGVPTPIVVSRDPKVYARSTLPNTVRNRVNGRIVRLNANGDVHFGPQGRPNSTLHDGINRIFAKIGEPFEALAIYLAKVSQGNDTFSAEWLKLIEQQWAPQPFAAIAYDENLLAQETALVGYVAKVINAGLANPLAARLALFISNDCVMKSPILRDTFMSMNICPCCYNIQSLGMVEHDMQMLYPVNNLALDDRTLMTITNLRCAEEAAKRHNREQHALNGNIAVFWTAYDNICKRGDALMATAGNVSQYVYGPTEVTDYIKQFCTKIFRNGNAVHGRIPDVYSIETQDQLVIAPTYLGYREHDPTLARVWTRWYGTWTMANMYNAWGWAVGFGEKVASEGYTRTQLGDMLISILDTASRSMTEITSILSQQQNVLEIRNITILASLIAQTYSKSTASGSTIYALKALGYAMAYTPIASMHSFARGVNTEYSSTTVRSPHGEMYPMSARHGNGININARAMDLEAFIKWSKNGEQNDEWHPNMVGSELAVVYLTPQMMQNPRLLSAATLMQLEYPFKHIGYMARVLNGDGDPLKVTTCNAVAGGANVPIDTGARYDAAAGANFNLGAPRVPAINNFVDEDAKTRVTANSTRLRVPGPTERVLYVLINSSYRQADLILPAHDAAVAAIDIAITRVGANNILPALNATINIGPWMEEEFNILTANEWFDILDHFHHNGLVNKTQIATAQHILATNVVIFAPMTQAHDNIEHAMHHTTYTGVGAAVDGRKIARDEPNVVMNGLFQRMIPIDAVRSGQTTIFIPPPTPYMDLLVLMKIVVLYGQAGRTVMKVNYRNAVTLSMVHYANESMKAVNYFVNMLAIPLAAFLPRFTANQFVRTLAHAKLGYSGFQSIVADADYEDNDIYNKLTHITARLMPGRVAINYYGNLRVIHNNLADRLNTYNSPTVYCCMNPEEFVSLTTKTDFAGVTFQKIRTNLIAGTEYHNVAVNMIGNMDTMSIVLRNMGTMFQVGRFYDNLMRTSPDGKSYMRSVNISYRSIAETVSICRKLGIIDPHVQGHNEIIGAWCNPFVFDLKNGHETTLALANDSILSGLVAQKVLFLTAIGDTYTDVSSPMLSDYDIHMIEITRPSIRSSLAPPDTNLLANLQLEAGIESDVLTSQQADNTGGTVAGAAGNIITPTMGGTTTTTGGGTAISLN